MHEVLPERTHGKRSAGEIEMQLEIMMELGQGLRAE